jgi:hypothetical protein
MPLLDQLFFDYVKNSLDNHSVQEFQTVNLCSEKELIKDISMFAANNILNDIRLQSNPHIMRGLQGIIPSCRMNIEMTDAGGIKASMSIAQARNQLKGQKKGSRKDLPQILTLGEHTPPDFIFLGGRKVSMSIAQARNKLKGQKKGRRKNLPQILSVKDHTPPASIFLSNAGSL